MSAEGTRLHHRVPSAVPGRPRDDLGAVARPGPSGGPPDMAATLRDTRTAQCFAVRGRRPMTAARHPGRPQAPAPGPLCALAEPVAKLAEKTSCRLFHGAPGSLVGTRFVLPTDQRNHP